MSQRNFVICTFDKPYGKKLLEMAINQKKEGLHFYLFHEYEKVEEFSQKQEVYVLVLGSEIPIEDRKQLRAKRKFLLREEMSTFEEESEESPVFKYQKGENILKEIYLESEVSKRADSNIEKKAIEESLDETSVAEILEKAGQGKVIGFYSPIHRIGKTQFAIALGKELAKEESVLYLNLEPFAKGSYFEEGEEGDLSDLLYLGSQENQNLGLCISVMAGQQGKLDYIKPMTFAEDLHAVEAKRWKELITKILEQSIYQTILLDMGDGVKDLFEMLDFCDTIYTLYIEEPIAKAKLKQYTNNLIKTGYDSILERTIQKKVELR